MYIICGSQHYTQIELTTAGPNSTYRLFIVVSESTTIPRRSQPSHPGPTQPPILSGTENEYRPRRRCTVGCPVRPSVCLSQGQQQRRLVDLLLSAVRAGDIDR